jgi:hypothetical protein
MYMYSRFTPSPAVRVCVCGLLLLLSSLALLTLHIHFCSISAHQHALLHAHTHTQALSLRLSLLLPPSLSNVSENKNIQTLQEVVQEGEYKDQKIIKMKPPPTVSQTATKTPSIYPPQKSPPL